MKLLPFFLLLISLNSFSQAKRDSFITVKYDIDTLDVQRIYYGLLNIEVSKYYIPSTFSSYTFKLITEEYLDGKVVKIRSLVDSLPVTALRNFKIGDNLEKNKFPVLLYSQKVDSTLKIYMVLGVSVGANEKLALIKGEDYSWKEVFDLQSKKHKLKPNVAFPLAAYTTAIGKEHSNYGENVAEFCRISGELIPPQNWYKELGIRHFFLFSIKLVK